MEYVFTDKAFPLKSEVKSILVLRVKPASRKTVNCKKFAKII